MKGHSWVSGQPSFKANNFGTKCLTGIYGYSSWDYYSIVQIGYYYSDDYNAKTSTGSSGNTGSNTDGKQSTGGGSDDTKSGQDDDDKKVVKTISATSNNIVIIAAGAGGGGFVLLVIIIMACCCCRSKNDKVGTQVVRIEDTDPEGNIDMTSQYGTEMQSRGPQSHPKLDP